MNDEPDDFVTEAPPKVADPAGSSWTASRRSQVITRRTPLGHDASNPIGPSGGLRHRRGRCFLAVMVRSTLRLATILVGVIAISGGAVAIACPPPSPDALTFRQMIRRHTTGERDFPIMIVGKVFAVRDSGGGPRGRAVARLAVAAHPTGFAPLVSRVRFYRPRVSNPDAFIYERLRRGHHAVAIASRRRDGSFDIIQTCGPSSEVGRHRFRRLVRLARRE